MSLDYPNSTCITPNPDHITHTPNSQDDGQFDDSSTDVTESTSHPTHTDIPDPSGSVEVSISSEPLEQLEASEISQVSPSNVCKIDWASLSATESRLGSHESPEFQEFQESHEAQPSQLFIDQCNLKRKEDWDDKSSTPPFSIAQLREIIYSSTSLPFNDIPNLPSIAYDDSELMLWSALISDYRAVVQHVPRYASMMVRSGIPPALRGHAWKSMAESASPTLESLYDSLAAEWTPFVKIIGRDLNRTFPELKMFSENGGDGQMKLGRVLRAYSAYDIQVGYCQGLTFLAGPLLLHMDDRSAFCTLVQLMEDYSLRSMFTPDMSGLQLRLYQFESYFSKHLPQLYTHFKTLCVGNVYVAQWFLSFFAVTCPLSMLVRVFDLVFSEGAIPTLMRMALAVLGRNQEMLMEFGRKNNQVEITDGEANSAKESDASADVGKQSEEEGDQILQILLGRNIWDCYNLDADLLIADVVAVDVCTTQSLAGLEKEFEDGGRPVMTNNPSSYSKPDAGFSESAKRSVSAGSSVVPSNASVTSLNSTLSSSTTTPINNVASYFTQFPWIKWQTPASSTPPVPSTANIAETDLGAPAYNPSRFSVASFDSMSTANSANSTGSFGFTASASSLESVGQAGGYRGNRVYGLQSSASSFSSYEYIPSSELPIPKNQTPLPTASSASFSSPQYALLQNSNSTRLIATLDENQALKDKVICLVAEIEKLRSELAQRERLDCIPENEENKKPNNERQVQNHEVHQLESGKGNNTLLSIPNVSNGFLATTSEKTEVLDNGKTCASCEKLTVELALAKSNETLANAEIEDLKHSLAKCKATIATLSSNSNNNSCNVVFGGNGSGTNNGVNGSSLPSPTSFPSSFSKLRTPSGSHRNPANNVATGNSINASNPSNTGKPGSSSSHSKRRSLFMSGSNHIIPSQNSPSSSSFSSASSSAQSLHARQRSHQIHSTPNMNNFFYSLRNGSNSSFSSVDEEFAQKNKQQASAGDKPDKLVKLEKLDKIDTSGTLDLSGELDTFEKIDNNAKTTNSRDSKQSKRKSVIAPSHSKGWSVW